MNTPEYETAKLVEITPREHGVELDIRYATDDNITGKAIYSAPRLFLRAEAEERLLEAVRLARAAGLRLVLFDGYRPPAAQGLLWKACPDENYVYPPWKGSTHTRGIAIDLTIAGLGMGTPFDDMSPRSHPGNTEVSQQVLRNRMLLAGIMRTAGFDAIKTEWWHFQLPGEWPLISPGCLPAPLMG